MAPRNFRIKIEPGKFYHIWNRGNNRENLFYSSRNYEYFIRLYAEYLDPVAETYAFCLLPNHFHLLIRTKSIEVSPAGETSKKQKHKIIDDFRQYPWSSYERIMRDKPSKLKKEEVLQWFRNKENYVNYHARTLDLDDLKDIIIE